MFIPLMMLAIATTACLASIRSAHADANTIFFQPNKLTAFVGQKFTVTVMVTVTNLGTIGVSIQWDPNMLNCTGFTWGTFLDPSPLKFAGEINNVTGMARGFAWGWTDTTGKTGTGSIIAFQFLVKNVGGSSLQFIVGPADTGMLDYDGDDMTFTPQDGYATLVQTTTHHITWSTYTFDIFTTSNSTVGTVNFDQPMKSINFTVTGPTPSAGFCNVTIPRNILDSTDITQWQVFFGLTDITANCIITRNATYTVFYVPYTHSTQIITVRGTWVIPEFPANLMLPLIVLASLAIIPLIRRKQKH